MSVSPSVSHSPAVPGITGSHDVFGVEHLLDELGDGEGTILLTPSGCQRREPGDEEVEAGEGNHVHGEFSQVRV